MYYFSAMVCIILVQGEPNARRHPPNGGCSPLATPSIFGWSALSKKSHIFRKPRRLIEGRCPENRRPIPFESAGAVKYLRLPTALRSKPAYRTPCSSKLSAQRGMNLLAAIHWDRPWTSSSPGSFNPAEHVHVVDGGSTTAPCTVVLQGSSTAYRFTTISTALGPERDVNWVDSASVEHLIGHLYRTDKVMFLPTTTSSALPRSEHARQDIKAYGRDRGFEGGVRGLSPDLLGGKRRKRKATRERGRMAFAVNCRPGYRFRSPSG